MQLKLRQRSNFAVQHLMAASRFSRLCEKVEQENAGNKLGPFYDEIVSYTSAAILSSVAALESNINEIFANAQDGSIKFQSLNLEQLREIWSLIEKKSILEKYQFTLVLNGKERIDKAEPCYQFINILIKVRNALVHFKPEWDDDQNVHKKIGEQLRGKFELSPFINESSPIFPTRCMTHGFTDWAVQSVLEFAKFYSDVVAFPNRFENFIKKLGHPSFPALHFSDADSHFSGTSIQKV